MGCHPAALFVLYCPICVLTVLYMCMNELCVVCNLCVICLINGTATNLIIYHLVCSLSDVGSNSNLVDAYQMRLDSEGQRQQSIRLRYFRVSLYCLLEVQWGAHVPVKVTVRPTCCCLSYRKLFVSGLSSVLNCANPQLAQTVNNRSHINTRATSAPRRTLRFRRTQSLVARLSSWRSGLFYSRHSSPSVSSSSSSASATLLRSLHAVFCVFLLLLLGRRFSSQPVSPGPCCLLPVADLHFVLRGALV